MSVANMTFWERLAAPFWRTPSAEELAARELQSAQRNLLEAHRHAEYYALMVQFERQRIARLSKTLKEITND